MDRRGTTLLELLVVLTLLSLLMGIGVGVAGRLDFTRRSAPVVVRRTIEEARAYAAARGFPARVQFDKGQGSFRRIGMRPVGTWHFEGIGTDGAFGIVLEMGTGAAVVADGRTGAALFLPKGSTASAPVRGLAPWQSRDGIAVDVEVRPEGSAGGLVVSRGKAWRLFLKPDGAAGAAVGRAAVEGTKEVSAGELLFESPPGCVLPGRWTSLGFVYDGAFLSLSVNGVLRGRARSEGEPLLAGEGDLQIGDPRRGFVGAVDSLRVSTVVAEPFQFLPEGVEFVEEGEIRFDGAGNLDPTVHAGEVGVGLRFENGATRAIRVLPYGTIR